MKLLSAKTATTATNLGLSGATCVAVYCSAISIISERKIRTASNPNLGDYFKNIKGVDFTASGLDSYNLSARGFNSSFSSRLLTLTDGRMAQVPSLRLIAYNVIPLSSDDVEQSTYHDSYLCKGEFSKYRKGK